MKTFVQVPLARPRNIMELQKTPEYGELIHHIWSSLRDEVAARPAREEGDQSMSVQTISTAPRERRGACRRAHATAC